jgi:hypothetical protein
MNGRLIAIWFACLVAFVLSAAVLLKYDSTAGPHGSPNEHLSDSHRQELSLTPDQTSLLVFIHPRCPCTAATLSELERLVGRVHHLTSTTVIAYIPSEEPKEWADTGLTQRALRLPNSRLLLDEDARLAEAFSVYTSGHTLLYDRHSQLQYSGGITGSRGHEGANVGTDSILAILKGESATIRRAPVYGCLIRGMQ